MSTIMIYIIRGHMPSFFEKFMGKTKVTPIMTFDSPLVTVEQKEETPVELAFGSYQLEFDNLKRDLEKLLTRVSRGIGGISLDELQKCDTSEVRELLSKLLGEHKSWHDSCCSFCERLNSAITSFSVSPDNEREMSKLFDETMALLDQLKPYDDKLFSLYSRPSNCMPAESKIALQFCQTAWAEDVFFPSTELSV